MSLELFALCTLGFCLLVVCVLYSRVLKEKALDKEHINDLAKEVREYRYAINGRNVTITTLEEDIALAKDKIKSLNAKLYSKQNKKPKGV